MNKIYIIIPISIEHLKSRYLHIFITINDLLSNIKIARKYIYQYKITIILNGIDNTNEYIYQFYECIKLIDNTIELLIISERSKVNAVNEGLRLCRNQKYDLFISADSDIRIPYILIYKMIALSCIGYFDAIVCEKAGLINKDSSEFQFKYSKFINLALEFRIFPSRRPTGSFYCLNPRSDFEFPAGCSEGDYLGSFKNIIHTNDFVYSEYPKTFEDEIIRRKEKAKIINNTHINIKRNIQDIEYVNWIEQHSPFPHYIQNDVKFIDSFNLFKAVIQNIS